MSLFPRNHQPHSRPNIPTVSRSIATGTFGFAFSALGILLAGVVISRFKPSARSMVSWNVLVGLVTVTGMLSYSLLGCPLDRSSMAFDNNAAAISR